MAQSNTTILKKLVLLSVLMFAFGYALVPLYYKLCEVTGINNILTGDKQVANTQVDPSRWVSVEFVANSNEQLPWQLKPLTDRVRVRPGELTQVMYEATNVGPVASTGQAVPSYGPQQAGQYFKKIECFCFRDQTLAPGETKRMPIQFVVERTLPRDIEVITLSYTFFEKKTVGAHQEVRDGRG